MQEAEKTKEASSWVRVLAFVKYQHPAHQSILPYEDQAFRKLDNSVYLLDTLMFSLRHTSIPL